MGRKAGEKKVGRSRVSSPCSQRRAEKRQAAEMAEGYRAVAGELKQLAAAASRIEHEVLPEWKQWPCPET